MCRKGRVRITQKLKDLILEIHNGQPGGWRQFPNKVGVDWPASWGLAQQIGQGRIQTTSPEVYHALGLALPAPAMLVEPPGGYEPKNLKEDLVKINRLKRRECRHPDCDTEFAVIGNGLWCSRHDWKSGYQFTREARELRRSLLRDD